jgi:hypothetical protein
MPDKLQQPAFPLRIFRPGEYDRCQIERTRAVIERTKQILAETDPTALVGALSRTSSNESE